MKARELIVTCTCPEVDYFAQEQDDSTCELTDEQHIALEKKLAAPVAVEPRRSEVVRPPFQKELTVIFSRDKSRALADADLASIKSGAGTVFRIGMPELYFHQLRLRVQENPELNKKIAAFYLKDGVMLPLGLTREDELKWPVGAFQEGWETETKIQQLRRADSQRTEGAGQNGRT